MLSPLSEGYDLKNWIIKFNDKSEGLLKFTLLAHNNMGYPMKISLFQTKENYENNQADRSYTMKIIKSTNLNLTLQLMPYNSPLLVSMRLIWHLKKF